MGCRNPRTPLLGSRDFGTPELGRSRPPGLPSWFVGNFVMLTIRAPWLRVVFRNGRVSFPSSLRLNARPRSLYGTDVRRQHSPWLFVVDKYRLRGSLVQPEEERKSFRVQRTTRSLCTPQALWLGGGVGGHRRRAVTNSHWGMPDTQTAQIWAPGIAAPHLRGPGNPGPQIRDPGITAPHHPWGPVIIPPGCGRME